MITAKYYIKNKQHLPTHQCSACFEVDYEFLITDCSCMRQLCKKCFYRYNAINQTIHICPGIKLAQKVGHYVTRPVQFLCPSQECRDTCRSQKQFNQHCKACPLINDDLREEFDLKANYMCKARHRLKFSTYRQACSICCDQHTYTSMCTQCKIFYCINCRPTPCSKTQCTKGHTLTAGVGNGYMNCDICAIPIKRMTNNRVFSDRRCDFDVCQGCYSKLPEEHPLPELRERRREPELHPKVEIGEVIDNDSSQEDDYNEEEGQ